jgi:hypothetical protein
MNGSDYDVTTTTTAFAAYTNETSGVTALTYDGSQDLRTRVQVYNNLIDNIIMIMIIVVQVICIFLTPAIPHSLNILFHQLKEQMMRQAIIFILLVMVILHQPSML